MSLHPQARAAIDAQAQVKVPLSCKRSSWELPRCRQIKARPGGVDRAGQVTGGGYGGYADQGVRGCRGDIRLVPLDHLVAAREVLVQWPAAALPKVKSLH